MRLTKSIREETRENIFSKLIQSKVNDLKKQIVEIAQELANKRYSKKINNWMNEGPKNSFFNMGTIYLKFGEKDYFYHSLLGGSQWGVKRSTIKLTKMIKVLAIDQYYEDINVDKRSMTKLLSIRDKLDNLETKKIQLLETVNSALWACNTKKQLEEHYPDLVQYLPKPPAVIKSIVVTNEKVNKIIKDLK